MHSSIPDDDKLAGESLAWTYEPPLAAAWTRWVTRTPRWLHVALALALVAVPLVLGLLEGIVGPSWESGEVRFWLLWPTLIIYTVSMMPVYVRTDRKLVSGLRPLVQLDDAEFRRVLGQVGHFKWQAEVMAFAVGFLFGMLIGNPSELLTTSSPLLWYLYLSAWTAFGLLGWIVLEGTMCTRLTSALYRQPISVDLFDISAFEPVGRQSLIIALTIIGGTLISLLFLFDPAVISSWQNLVIYTMLTIITVTLFFANMWPTHRLLAATKRAYLSRTVRRISAAYHRLDQVESDGVTAQDDMVALNAELSALIGAEQRLKVTRSWPYNTETLRTLAISVLMPLFVGLSRLLAVWLTSAPAR